MTFDSSTSKTSIPIYSFDSYYFENVPNQALPAFLICSICTEPYNHPLTHLCGNSFCKHCWDKNALLKLGCALCRQPGEAVPEMPIVFRSMLSQLLLRCIACNSVVTREDATKHVNDCKLPCADCKQEISTKNQQDHRDHHCPNRWIKCNASVGEYICNRNGRLMLRFGELDCLWEGPHDQKDAHYCLVENGKKLQMETRKKFAINSLINPIDASLIGQGRWVKALQCEDSDCTFTYFHPREQVEKIETFASKFDFRVGQYYNCEFIEGIDTSTKDICFAIDIGEEPSRETTSDTSAKDICIAVDIGETDETSNNSNTNLKRKSLRVSTRPRKRYMLR